jgi:hypothetical protein
MAHYDLQEPFQTPPPLLNDRVIEAIQVDFAWERRDRNASGFAFEQVPEDLEVGVPTPHFGAPELEGRDVRAEADEVGCIAGGGGGGGLVGLRFCDLRAYTTTRQLVLSTTPYPNSGAVPPRRESWLQSASRTSISKKFSGTP